MHYSLKIGMVSIFLLSNVTACANSKSVINHEPGGDMTAADQRSEDQDRPNRLFSRGEPVRVPDETIVYPFLNPKDITSNLPWDLFEDFSIAVGKIEAGVCSKIHLMPLVTQVTYVLSGKLEVKMKEADHENPYLVQVQSSQAVLTKAGTFLQLLNTTTEPCLVLYIVSPSYLFDTDANGNVLYDDSIVLEEDWNTLERLGWSPPVLLDSPITPENRRKAYEHLANKR